MDPRETECNKYKKCFDCPYWKQCEKDNYVEENREDPDYV